MKIVFCDDEDRVSSAFLPKMRTRYRDAEIAVTKSGEELLSLSDAGDIIILDVQMPGLSGMETAKRLRQRGSNAILIFLTGREDRVFEAFEFEAFRYLIKPVSEEDFFAALDAAAAKYEKTRTQATGEDADVLINCRGRHIRIRIADVIYAEIYNRRISLHTTDGDYEYYGRLQELSDAAGDVFFRPHRSFLVNLKYVSDYSGREITMTSGDTVILSKTKYAQFVKAYMAYIKGEP